MRSPFLSMVPILLSGCAGIAVQPATPARYWDVRGAEHPNERYYVLIFSSERESKLPRYTHTWATCVRVAPREPGNVPIIEQHTISWMPATLEIKPARLYMEPGVNLGLHDTITHVALANDEKIGLWGPYECRSAFFNRFLAQKQFMESGQVLYQCVDVIGEAARTGRGCNCVHAVSDMDSEHGRRQSASTRYGFAAGGEMARRFRELDRLVDSSQTHDFLIPILKLNSIPMIRGKAGDVLLPSRLPIIGGR